MKRIIKYESPYITFPDTDTHIGYDVKADPSCTADLGSGITRYLNVTLVGYHGEKSLLSDLLKMGGYTFRYIDRPFAAHSPDGRYTLGGDGVGHFYLDVAV